MGLTVCDIWNEIHLVSLIIVLGLRFYKRHFAFSFSKSIFVLKRPKNLLLHGHAEHWNAASISLYEVLQNGSTRVMAEHFVKLKAIRFVTGSIKIRVNFGPRPFTGARLGLKLSSKEKWVNISLLSRTPQFFKETGGVVLPAFSNLTVYYLSTLVGSKINFKNMLFQRLVCLVFLKKITSMYHCIASHQGSMSY